MENCVFCKIINKEIKTNIIYEDKSIIAFLDMTQISDGHTLIVSKKHFDNLLVTPDKLILKMFSKIKEISSLLKEKLSAKGFNIITNINKEAGQSINHVHIHLIPRYNVDEFDFKYEKRQLEPKAIEEIKNKIIN